MTAKKILLSAIVTSLFGFVVMVPGLKAMDCTMMKSMNHEKCGTNSGSGTNAPVKNPLKQSLKGPQAKIGDVLMCPVLGPKFTVTAKSPYAVIKGKKIYVCCAGCVEPLKKDPGKYLK
jgi:hypothetical protein